jgi:hypothetical protein
VVCADDVGDREVDVIANLLISEGFCEIAHSCNAVASTTKLMNQLKPSGYLSKRHVMTTRLRCRLLPIILTGEVDAAGWYGIDSTYPESPPADLRLPIPCLALTGICGTCRHMFLWCTRALGMQTKYLADG